MGMIGQMTETEPRSLAAPFRRRVFYIPGYDPIHPRRYRELYRKEGQAQAEYSGYTIDLKPKKIKGPYGWQVSGQIEAAATVADIEVLVWSDIVRHSMNPGILGTYLQLMRTARAYIGSGALFRLMQLRKGPMIAALYPIAMLLLQLLLAIGAGFAVAFGFATLINYAQTQVYGPPFGFGPLFYVQAYGGLVVLVGVTILTLRWFRAKDSRFFAYYLMHDYAFSAQTGGANPAQLEARMRDFRRAIAAALTGPYDEVLVVGHSSGAHLAVSILADLIRDGLPAAHPVLSFLSLGQVVPMVSFLPKATRLRADLYYLSARPDLFWLDVTAPGDGCAFALCDPVAVSGVAPPNKLWPLVMSAAFTQTLSAARWKELRWRFFRLHFQYLCAFDNLAGAVSDYDYFRITAGPLTLAQRYSGRAASKSRIERATSGYTSIA